MALHSWDFYANWLVAGVEAAAIELVIGSSIKPEERLAGTPQFIAHKKLGTSELWDSKTVPKKSSTESMLSSLTIFHGGTRKKKRHLMLHWPWLLEDVVGDVAVGITMTLPV